MAVEGLALIFVFTATAGEYISVVCMFSKVLSLVLFLFTATAGEYISVACMFSKVLSLVLFYQVYVPYAFVYAVLCLGKSKIIGILKKF